MPVVEHFTWGVISFQHPRHSKTMVEGTGAGREKYGHKQSIFFFLENVEELRFIVLRRKCDKNPLQHTHPNKAVHATIVFLSLVVLVWQNSKIRPHLSLEIQFF
jgi:hypothetical protein